MIITIFVPGVGGSVLTSRESNQTLYPGSMCDYIFRQCDKMKFCELMNATETTFASKVLTGYLGKSIYRKFKRSLTKSGFDVFNGTHDASIAFLKQTKQRQPVIFFPWNWILGIDDACERLQKFCEDCLALFEPNQMLEKTDKYETTNCFDGFIMIGHSAGGIISHLLKSRNTKIKVLRIVSVASPFDGVDNALSILTLKKTTDTRWFSTFQTILLSHKFQFIYDFLPKNTPVEQHLDACKVNTSNKLKLEIQNSLQSNSSVLCSFFIYNISFKQQYEYKMKKQNGGAQLLPILGDNVVPGQIAFRKQSTTFYIDTEIKHALLMNHTATIEKILTIIK